MLVLRTPYTSCSLRRLRPCGSNWHFSHIAHLAAYLQLSPSSIAFLVHVRRGPKRTHGSPRKAPLLDPEPTPQQLVIANEDGGRI